MGENFSKIDITFKTDDMKIFSCDHNVPMCHGFLPVWVMCAFSSTLYFSVFTRLAATAVA